MQDTAVLKRPENDIGFIYSFDNVLPSLCKAMFPVREMRL